MSRVAYTYCALRYVHDIATGESLNIGVVLLAPQLHYVGVIIDPTYRRLSEAFVEFDGDQHRKVVRRFHAAIKHLQKLWANPMGKMFDVPVDAQALMRQIWADQGLSYQYSAVLSGLARSPEIALQDAYDRMVVSKSQRAKVETRSDDDVWNSVYKGPLRQTRAASALKPITLKTNAIELKCEYTFKNERIHIVQPMTFDYAREESISAKAAKWLGNATALAGHEELGTMYLLLGKPQMQKHLAAYHRAKNMLDRIPIDHVLVEEEEAEKFAEDLSQFMREHGVIASESDTSDI
ncbi:MAG: hypothetical protein JWQ02_4042 [Capsulimonas sp.]|jgi:hypothetical protein|nr:hypothetical protein [Capsulimonas sp.]